MQSVNLKNEDINYKVSDSVAAMSEMKNQLAVQQNAQKKNKMIIGVTMVLIWGFLYPKFPSSFYEQENVYTELEEHD